MEQSENINELIAALAKARSEFGPIVRDTSGQAGNQRYKYAPLEAALEATVAALSANGLAVVQLVEGDAEAPAVTTQIAHTSGQWIRSTLPVSLNGVRGSGPQALGSAITYGRRYAYLAIIGVQPVGEDDDGAEASGRSKPHGGGPRRQNNPTHAAVASGPPPSPPVLTDAKKEILEQIRAAREELGIERSHILREFQERYQKTDVAQMSESMLRAVLEDLRNASVLRARHLCYDIGEERAKEQRVSPEEYLMSEASRAFCCDVTSLADWGEKDWVDLLGHISGN